MRRISKEPIELFEMPRLSMRRAGRRRRIPEPMQRFIIDRLAEELDLYRDELQEELEEAFAESITRSRISRELNAINWTCERLRRIAQQRDDDLRNNYLYNIA